MREFFYQKIRSRDSSSHSPIKNSLKHWSDNFFKNPSSKQIYSIVKVLINCPMNNEDSEINSNPEPRCILHAQATLQVYSMQIFDMIIW